MSQFEGGVNHLEWCDSEFEGEVIQFEAGVTATNSMKMQ